MTSLEQVREIADLFLKPEDPTPPRLRQGIIAGIGMGRVDVLLEGTFSIGGIPFLSSYVPRIGDVVWLIKNGADMFVLGDIVSGGVDQEAWHFVDDTEYNEPPFQNGWVNYATTTPGVDYGEAKFYIDVDGWVTLQGLLRNPTGAAYNSVMFTLPVGYRPAGTRRIPVLRSNNEIWQIEIRSDGTVRAATANNGDAADVKIWISLTGVKFMADNTAPYEREYEWTALGYGPNLWTWDTSAATGNTYDFPALWHRWDGLVRARGTLMGGDGPIIGIVTERGARTRYAKVFASATYTAFITIEPCRIDMLAHNRALRTLTYDPNWNDGMALGGLQWFADIPESYWTSLDLLNSWVEYNDMLITRTVYAKCAYYRDGYGDVHVRGLAKNGTTTPGTVIAILPETCRPAKRLTFVADTSSGFGRLDVSPDGELIIMSGGNSHYSLDAVSFRADQ